MSSSNLGLIALLAVYDFRSLRRVGGLKFVVTMLSVRVRGMRTRVRINAVFGFFARALAGPIPEFERIAPGKPLIMTAIGTEARQGKIVLAVELEFFGDDLERGRALMRAFPFVHASDDFIKNLVFHRINVVGERFRAHRYLIIFLRRGFPYVSFGKRVFLRKRIVFLRDGLVVGERRYVGRKKFPVLICAG